MFVCVHSLLFGLVLIGIHFLILAGINEALGAVWAVFQVRV
jgi:hypothetical protein